MPRFAQSCLVALSALVLFVGFAETANAQNASPSVTIMQSGADELLADLKYITLLAGKVGKAQWKNVQANIGIFLGGIDRKKPIRIDILLGGPDVYYRSSFPILNFKNFRTDNLVGLGINSKKIGGTLYKLSGGFEGFMRFTKGYATIAERKADIPAKMANPADALAPLLKKKYDFAVDIHNTKAGLNARHKEIQKLRKQLLAGIKAKEKEEEGRFAARKLLLDFQMDEAERFYAEASQLTFGLTTDPKKKESRLELHLAAIDGTDLDKAIQALGTKPSYFANIKRSDNAILAGRINHPLDKMRTNHLVKLFGALRTFGRELVEGDTEQKAEEKDSEKKIVDQVFDMLVAGAKVGELDAFYEMQQKAGKRTLIAGMKAQNGNGLFNIIQLLPQARPKLKVKLDVDKEGEVGIHSVSVPVKHQASFRDLFGGDPVVYFGTSQDAVWCAAGESALDEMKAAIKKVGMPNEGKPDPVFAELYAKAGPWVELLDQRRKREAKKAKVDAGKKLTAKEKRLRKELAEMRQSAIAAFKAGDDTVTLTLKRLDDHVEGRIRFGEGLLRFLGKQIAKFSAESLE